MSTEKSAESHGGPQPSTWAELRWGVALVGALALAATFASQTPWIRQLGLSPLTLAILLGILAGNTFFPRLASRTGAGVDFAKNRLLRAGIVLYGWRLTFHDLTAVGWPGLLIDAAIVGLTFTLAVQLGTRLFRLDRETAMLIGAGSAICGAAAVLAAEPVIRGQAHRVSVAVATVVVFGTLGMFIYPLLYPHLGLSEQAFGMYAGSTIHEVAQVVAASRTVSDAAAATAVIEKMLRVMLLAPFLLLLSSTRQGPTDSANGSRARRFVPWFAVLFIAVCAINSLHVLPAASVDRLVQVDNALLAMAMAGLGLRTRIGAVRQAGLRPLLLALSLFLFLMVGGYGINRLVTSLLS